MDIEIDTIELPTYFASYLISGDGSGLEDDEQTEAEQIESELMAKGWHVSDVSEDSFFGEYNGLGHDLSTYTIYRKRQ